jgi:hypothetical protein
VLKENAGHLKTERPLGVNIIIAMYLLLSFSGTILVFLGYFFKPSYTFIAVFGLLMFTLLVSAIGLFKLEYWGWYLAVGGSIGSLILYGIAIKQWFPLLEILTLPYLVGQREIFGVTKRIKKKWLKITFVTLVIATTIWGISFYWTRQEYNASVQRFLEWLEEHYQETPLCGYPAYFEWDGGVYVWRTLFLLFCAWTVFIVLWRTRLETIYEMKKPAQLGLVIFGLALFMLFTATSLFMLVIDYDYSSWRYFAPWIFGSVVFLLIGFYMMKSGVKKEKESET